MRCVFDEHVVLGVRESADQAVEEQSAPGHKSPTRGKQAWYLKRRFRSVLLLFSRLIAEAAVRLSLVECLVPGKCLEFVASRAREMGFEASGPVDHVDPGIAQEPDAALEGRVRGERTVDERQHDDGYAQADRFSEDAQSKVVADAVDPFVDRVVGGRCDDDGIGRGRDSSSKSG